MPLPLSAWLSVCAVCEFAMSVCVLCVCVLCVCVCAMCVLSVLFCLLCYALLSFSCFCVFNKRNGPTHTHKPTSPPSSTSPLSPSLSTPLPKPVTSRFYDFDICFRLPLCMQMMLALMVTQMIAGCCLVTVGRGGRGAAEGVTWI